MHRLFMALRVPESGEFMRVLDRLGGVRGVKAVDPQNLHYTLRFFGELPDETFHMLADAVRAGAFGPPFDVRIQGTGAFPDTRRPRVVWAACDAAAEPHFARLAGAVDDVSDQVALGPRDKKFVPHLTLARVKRLEGRGAQDVEKILRDERDTAYGEMRAGHVVLVESTLGPDGPRYDDVVEVALP